MPIFPFLGKKERVHTVLAYPDSAFAPSQTLPHEKIGGRGLGVAGQVWPEGLPRANPPLPHPKPFPMKKSAVGICALIDILHADFSIGKGF